MQAELSKEAEITARESRRFLQDCRKRALDLAHEEKLRNGGDAIAIADKYYEWLIKEQPLI